MVNVLQGMQYVQQQGELGRQRGTQSRLASLASQAYGAPQDQQRGLVQQAIQSDPEQGFALNKQLGDDRGQRLQSMSQKARMLVAYAKAGNRAGVDGLYPQLAQEAQQLGLGQSIPPTWDDSYLPGMEQLANIGGGGAKGPEQFTLGPGSKRFNPDGSVVAEVPFAPANGNIVKVPDGQGGTIDMVWDPRERKLSDLPLPGAQQAPGQPAQASAGIGDDHLMNFQTLATQFPGTQITSLNRSKADNDRVGGVANSQHMSGTAGDFVVPPAQKSAFIQTARSMGYEAIDEGDHVHLELPPGAQAAQVGGRPGYTPPKGQSETDIERRLELARQMGASDEELRRMVVGGNSGRDAQRISTADTTKARQKMTQIASARQQLEAVKENFRKLKGTFSAGIGGQYLPTPEGQAFDRAIANLAPLVTAVTRVPGIGAMSDYESRLQNASLPSRGTYENVTEQQIADLERLFDTIESGYTDLLSGAQMQKPAPSDAPQSNAVPSGGVLRYNPATGDFE